MGVWVQCWYLPHSAGTNETNPQTAPQHLPCLSGLHESGNSVALLPLSRNGGKGGKGPQEGEDFISIIAVTNEPDLPYLISRVAPGF